MNDEELYESLIYKKDPAPPVSDSGSELGERQRLARDRKCPRCHHLSVIEDGYCGICRECTLPALRATPEAQDQSAGQEEDRLTAETPGAQ